MGWRDRPRLGQECLSTYLSQSAVLDFILEDKPIGVRWLKPVQDDTALASCLPGNLPWDAIGLSCKRFLSFTFKPRLR